jgi:superoxide dismutase, Fe-Mn family
MKTINDILKEEIEKTISESLEEKGVIKENICGKVNKEILKESYVTQTSKFDLKTQLLSDKTKKAHQELLDNYVETLNKISAKLDGASKEEGNLNSSLWRSLKIDEAYNHNAVFLHGLFFQNISDLKSQIAMDSLTFMRLERDFGSFDNWQADFIACAMSSRNGWVITCYNTQLKRYVNVMLDLHSQNLMIGCHPLIVLDCWEHSYYRDYLSNRLIYVKGMMKELNWDIIEERFKVAEKISKALG